MSELDHSLISELPLFAGLRKAELDEILDEARPLHLPKNARAFEQGEDAPSFFVLLHGHIRAAKTTVDGQQVIVRFVTPGETFGVAVAIGVSAYPATATAVDDSLNLGVAFGRLAPLNREMSGAVGHDAACRWGTLTRIAHAHH